MLESNHTLILGWSDKTLNMIDQLCLANESACGKAIVILAERVKQDMEEDIHKHIRDLRGSRVLCRCAASCVRLVEYRPVGRIATVQCKHARACTARAVQ